MSLNTGKYSGMNGPAVADGVSLVYTRNIFPSRANGAALLDGVKLNRQSAPGQRAVLGLCRTVLRLARVGEYKKAIQSIIIGNDITEYADLMDLLLQENMAMEYDISLLILGLLGIVTMG